MALEYETPPKHISPIVKFKSNYENIYKFAADFYSQTGIELSNLFEIGIKNITCTILICTTKMPLSVKTNQATLLLK